MESKKQSKSDSKLVPPEEANVIVVRLFDAVTSAFNATVKHMENDQKIIDILKSECERKDKVINRQKRYINFLESVLDEKG